MLYQGEWYSIARAIFFGEICDDVSNQFSFRGISLHLYVTLWIQPLWKISPFPRILSWGWNENQWLLPRRAGWWVGWPQYRNQHFDHQDEPPMNLTETETSRSQYDSVKMWFYFPSRMHGKDLDATMRRHLEVSGSGSQVVESWEGFFTSPLRTWGRLKSCGMVGPSRSPFQAWCDAAWYLGCSYNYDYKYISMTRPKVLEAI